MARKALLSAVVATLVCAAAACTTEPDTVDRSGGQRDVVLHLATAEAPDRPGTAVVDRFVAAVAASGAPVHIEVTTDVAEGSAGWDQAAIDLLDDGYELVLAPARAWRSEDVTTLDALQLPTLVESDEQADRVVKDLDLVDDLLAGLSAAHAHGLGLYPESLRGIAVLDGSAPLTSSTLSGLRVRAPLAPTVWETIRALGGTPVDLPTFHPGTGPEQIQAVETQLSLLDSLPGSPWALTVDLPLYYKFQVLAASETAWSELDPYVQGVLSGAAAKALSDTLADRPHQADFVDAACGSAHTILLAGGDGDDVRTRLASLVGQAEQDEATADRVAALRAAAGAPPAPPAATTDACGGDRPITWDEVPPRPGDIPDGTYRVFLDADTLREAGWPENDLTNNAGTYTFVLDGGRYTWDQHTDVTVPGPTSGTGTYAVDGDRVQWAWEPALGGFVTETTWELGDDGSLRFAAQPELPWPAGATHIQLLPLERID